jgi:hypothetical protein
MESSQKRNRDRRQREKREEKERRRKERAANKVLGRTGLTPDYGTGQEGPRALGSSAVESTGSVSP